MDQVWLDNHPNLLDLFLADIMEVLYHQQPIRSSL
jgi:hypothetical protein